jgi:hypothetical protein
VDVVLENVLKNKKNELLEMSYVLADAAYTEIYSGALSHMMALPHGAFLWCTGIIVEFDGVESEFLPFKRKSADSSSARPFFQKTQHIFNSEHELTVKFTEYTTAKDLYTSNKDKKKKELWELLSSITTTSLLSKVWPEGAIYYDPIIYEKLDAKHLPAVTLDVLNSKFNIVLQET